MLLVLLLAPCVLCFAATTTQTHACCGHDTAVRTQARKDCCVFAPAPAPAQPAIASVMKVDHVAPASVSVSAVPGWQMQMVSVASNEPSPDGLLVRFPSNLRI
jgi:hypothetical protein